MGLRRAASRRKSDSRSARPAVCHRIGAAVQRRQRNHRRRCSARLASRRKARACSCGRRPAPARTGCPRSSEPRSISANTCATRRPVATRCAATARWSREPANARSASPGRRRRPGRPRVALGAQHPGAELDLVGPQQQDRVVELARGSQRPPSVAGGDDRVGCSGPGLDGARRVNVALRSRRSKITSRFG